MAISKEIQKSSEMKFDGKLIKVTYDIADVNGNEAWREVVHHPGATAIVVVTEDNKIVMERQFRYALQQPLLEIPAGKRGKNADIKRILEQEGKAMLAACGKGKVVTLDIPGKPWTTPQLAEQLESWKNDGRDVCLLIGGPEGLSPECKAAAEQSWSLSPLTMPHPLVRVVVAESLYRAWSLTTNHPYHRE